MEKSCNFYSKLPGLKLVRGGKASPFSTFEVGEGSRMYINLELRAEHDDEENIIYSSDTNFEAKTGSNIARKKQQNMRNKDFGRVIFYSEDVDDLYQYLINDHSISDIVAFEGQPRDAPWGERFFHIIEPDGNQLSFAQPISTEKTFLCE